MTDWTFGDPPNLAVIATRGIVEGTRWIAHVSYDAEDGAWQFHDDTPGQPREDDARVVSLRSMLARDPTLTDLADLPRGWRAWRAAPGAPWQRAGMEQHSVDVSRE